MAAEPTFHDFTTASDEKEPRGLDPSTLDVEDSNLLVSSNGCKDEYVVKLANGLRSLIQSHDTKEIVKYFLSTEVIRALRNSLVSALPAVVKHGVFVLKTLTSYFLNFEGDEIALDDLQMSNVMLHNGTLEFKLFWSDFFDLFEILNEKQYHIIQPFLPKLKSTRFQNEPALCWLMVLVNKMINHDNRVLAKEGLNIFLDYGLALSAQVSQESRDDQMDFIQNSLFPVLKDRIGWIMVEPTSLMESAKKLGQLLTLLTNEDETFSRTLPALKLILNAETDMGPVVTYFLVRATYHQLTDENEQSSSSLSGNVFLDNASSEATLQFENFLDEVNYCVVFRLTALDRFLKAKIQQCFVDMVIQQLHHLKIQGIFHRCNLDVQKSKDGALSLHMKILEFLGALDVNTFCSSIEKLAFVVNSDKSQESKQQTWSSGNDTFVTELFSQTNHSVLRMKGFFRWLILHKNLLENSWAEVSASPSREEFAKLLNTILGKKFNEELFSTTKEEFESTQDFLQCLVTIRRQENEPLQEMIQSLLSLSSFAVLNCIYALNEKKISTSLFLTTALQILPSFKYAISDTKLNFDDEFFSKLQLLIARNSELPVLSRILLLTVILLQGKVYGTTLCGVAGMGQLCKDGKNLVLQLQAGDLADKDTSKNEIRKNFSNLKLAVLAEVCKQSDMLTTIFQSKDEVSELLDVALSFLETSTGSSLVQAISICKVVADLALHYEHNEILTDLTTNAIENAWQRVTELQKSEYFWDACSSFLALASSPSLYSKNILPTYSSKLFELSEKIAGLPLLLAEELSRVNVRALSSEEKYSKYLEDLMEINIKAACFGSAVSKSMKFTFNLWEYLCANETRELHAQFGNYERKISLPFNGSVKCRLISLLNIIAQLEVACESGKAEYFLPKVVQALLQINEGDSVDKRRYFVGSQVHRVKQRIVQILLILQPYFDKDLSQKVMKTLLVSLGNDGPQASVRFLSEWIITNILLKYNELHDEFFTLSSKCCLVRPGFGALFATIALHTSANLPKNSSYTTQFYDATLQSITSLLMSQNFTVRIYGNISFCKIFENAVRFNLTSIIPKYQVVYTSAQETVATAAGNFRKIYDSVLNDFYVKIFSPVHHNFYDVIFIHLPRIAKMCADEIIHEVDLQDISLNFKTIIKLNLPYFSPFEVQTLYKDNKEYSWHLKTSLIDGREQEEEFAEMRETYIDVQPGNMFQVKGNPWKYLPIADEIHDFPPELQLKKKSRQDGLVVVASLIDRIPNLGGLCRTCEVFGASKYIISSLKFLDDQHFKSLSVSAHRWVDILEVPVQDLKSFLMSYSGKGYTIVGVEQALESSTLNTFVFPKKTVLLLGNEKYGIPTDLLSLVDNCVEIPQVGLIRSLNVHVTGALCIWQYASQHII